MIKSQDISKVLGPPGSLESRPGKVHRRPLLSLSRLSLRLFLALAAAMIFVSPFALAFYLHYRQEWLGPQSTTSPARFSAEEIRQFRSASAAATHGQGAEPIVLAYQDVAWNSSSQNVVTPAAFEAQMAMLYSAGYHTLTARQLVRYAQGGSVPSHSVAITFDGSARGLWTYADEILRRYHFHGIAFLVTSQVGTRQPYYLTWQEVGSMYSSGYWDFESNTNDLARKARTGSRRLGDPLTQRIWLISKHRLESIPQFIARIHKDLSQSIVEMEDNSLPRPILFAYPFPDGLGPHRDPASRYAGDLIDKLFALALTNSVEPPVPVSYREAAGGVIDQLGVSRSQSTAALFYRLREMASLPVADTSSFDDHSQWLGLNGATANIVLRKRNIILQGRRKWNYAAYAPGATADWDAYEISVDIRFLNYRVHGSATISVRVGSRSQLNISVASHYMAARLGAVQGGATALARVLPTAPVHRVTIKVLPDTTVVFVDGQVVMFWMCGNHSSCVAAVTPGRFGSGGFALSGFRSGTNQPFARFDDVTVERLAS